VVGSVEQDSPAADAGIRAGDVIVAIDKHPIRSSADLRNRVGLTPAGSQVEVVYLRDGKRGSVAVRIEAERSGPAEPAPDRLQGAQFQDANGSVFVAAVEEGSAAARSGLRTGDIIVAVNRQPVSTMAELTAALRRAAGTIALDLFRGGMRFFLVIR
jgi:S1-C subfamily serine protease